MPSEKPKPAVEKLMDEMRDLKVSIRDSLKWKVVLTGSVTAIGLGFTGPSTPNAYLAMSAAPLIAAYCDVLIRDYELRVAIQAAYLRNNGDSEHSKYETFLEEQNIKDTEWWILRRDAIMLSSLFVCIFIGGFAAWQCDAQSFTTSPWIVPILTALVGAVVVTLVQVR
ncbi:MAG: hypothetical protein AAFY36_18495, partial [Bacteroidota bacterium]